MSLYTWDGFRILSLEERYKFAIQRQIRKINESFPPIASDDVFADIKEFVQLSRYMLSSPFPTTEKSRQYSILKGQIENWLEKLDEYRRFEIPDEEWIVDDARK